MKFNDKVSRHTDFFLFAVILKQGYTQAGLEPAVLLENTTLSLPKPLTFFLLFYFFSCAE